MFGSRIEDMLLCVLVGLSLSLTHTHQQDEVYILVRHGGSSREASKITPGGATNWKHALFWFYYPWWTSQMHHGQDTYCGCTMFGARYVDPVVRVRVVGRCGLEIYSRKYWDRSVHRSVLYNAELVLDSRGISSSQWTTLDVSSINMATGQFIRYAHTFLECFSRIFCSCFFSLLICDGRFHSSYVD